MYQVSVSVLDAKGKTSQFKAYYPASFDLAAIDAAAGEFATTVNALVLGAITGISITRELATGALGLRAVPGVTSDVEEVGRFIFSTAANKHLRISLPTWNEAFTNPNSAEINRAHATVAPFITHMTTYARDSNDVVLTAAIEAYEAYGKTRRRG